MKNIPIAVFTLVSFLSSKAQYYYKDIIGTQNINQLIKLYKDNRVVEVEATGTMHEDRYDNLVFTSARLR